MEWIGTGIVMGVLGSLHCLGMCGPIALGLPIAKARPAFVAGRLLYNIGRVTTYVLLGGLFGLVGMLAVLAGYLQALSIGVGVLMIAAAVVMFVGRRLTTLSTLLSRAVQGLFAWIPKLYQRGGSLAMFAVGGLNGLLPCGLVYAALGVAATSGTTSGAMQFMAAFGLGTVPAMFAVSLMPRLMQPQWRARLQKRANKQAGIEVTGEAA